MLRTRLSALGIGAHFGDDIHGIEEVRQMAREIMEQLRPSLTARHADAESPDGDLRAEFRAASR